MVITRVNNSVDVVDGDRGFGEAGGEDEFGEREGRGEDLGLLVGGEFRVEGEGFETGLVGVVGFEVEGLLWSGAEDEDMAEMVFALVLVFEDLVVENFFDLLDVGFLVVIRFVDDLDWVQSPRYF